MRGTPPRKGKILLPPLQGGKRIHQSQLSSLPRAESSQCCPGPWWVWELTGKETDAFPRPLSPQTTLPGKPLEPQRKTQPQQGGHLAKSQWRERPPEETDLKGPWGSSHPAPCLQARPSFWTSVRAEELGIVTSRPGQGSPQAPGS